jgi:hypothetical protein
MHIHALSDRHRSAFVSELDSMNSSFREFVFYNRVSI